MTALRLARLDRVAILIAPGVEGRRPASGPAAAPAMVHLVFFDGYDGLDAAAAQVGPVGSRGIGLVAHHAAGPGAGPSPAATADADGLQERDELWAVAMLARGEDPGERAAAPVRGQVNLGGQPAAGAAQPLPARTRHKIVVIRSRPLWAGPRRWPGAPRPRAGGPVPPPNPR